jgi:hypothetical protein
MNEAERAKYSVGKFVFTRNQIYRAGAGWRGGDDTESFNSGNARCRTLASACVGVIANLLVDRFVVG